MRVRNGETLPVDVRPETATHLVHVDGLGRTTMCYIDDRGVVTVAGYDNSFELPATLKEKEQKMSEREKYTREEVEEARRVAVLQDAGLSAVFSDSALRDTITPRVLKAGLSNLGENRAYKASEQEVREVWAAWSEYGGLTNRTSSSSWEARTAEFNRWLAEERAKVWDEAIAYVSPDDVEIMWAANPYRKETA